MAYDPDSDVTDAANSDSAADVEDSPATRPRRQPAIRPAIDSIETVPMTPEERTQAVNALAELIVAWEKVGAPTKIPRAGF
ncbi:hypothetical protein MXD62_17030 [Frankia sp. Mgl5]|uniref:hypothetical protein n=1 Tax=unclassified Frankia TaxID=2632575 RepID=UPI00200C3BE9|nr:MULTISPECIES: hypothetical protein [unclassified Frankia]MCK9928861.1 hypothetical protein [Frankia sp. Mgl5]